jgi:hypothetical protein
LGEESAAIWLSYDEKYIFIMENIGLRVMPIKTSL